jgi:hypothetical protein
MFFLLFLKENQSPRRNTSAPVKLDPNGHDAFIISNENKEGIKEMKLIIYIKLN